VVAAMREQGAARGLEGPGLVRAEVIGEDEVERRAGLGLVVVMPVGVVPAAAAGYLLGGQPKEEEVLLARLFRHLDGRAVAGADRQRPVHHELHVARTARLVAGGRYLVRDVTRRDQTLRERHAVLWKE